MIQDQRKSNMLFTAARQVFVEHGFAAQELLPLIPPGAVLSPDSHIKSLLGKIPGEWHAQRRPACWTGMRNWPREAQASSFVTRTANFPTSSVGLLAERWPAIDIDLEEPVLLEQILQLAEQQLGRLWVRGRTGSNRCLLIYSAAEPLTMAKLARADGSGEVQLRCGRGKQYVVAGPHPAGDQYHWDWGIPAVNTIAAIDSAQVDAFFSALERLGGWVTRKQAQQQALNQDVQPVAETGVVWEALSYLPPNTRANVESREQFCSIVAKVRAALGPEEAAKPESAELFLAWAEAETDPITGEPWGKRSWARPIWYSLERPYASPSSLFRLAQRHGFPLADYDLEEYLIDPFEEVAEKYAYHEPNPSRLIHKASLVEYNETGFDRCGDGVRISDLLRAMRTPGQKRIPRPHSVLLRQPALARVHKLMYSAGREPVFPDPENPDQLVLNRWSRRPWPRAEASQPKPWLDHVALMLPVVDEQRQFMQFLACVVQHPGRKIRWAPLLIGPQGVGKSLLYHSVCEFLGKQNFKPVNAETFFNGRRNEHWEAELIIVSEIDNKDKEQYSKIKAPLTDSYLRVDQKYLVPYYIENLANVIFCTNYDDAFQIPADDRRLFVLRSGLERRREPGYYPPLWRWLDQDGGNAEVIAYLRAYDLNGFSLDAPPLMTEAKREMFELSRSHLADWVAQQLQPGGLLARRTVLTMDELFSLAGRGYLRHQEIDRAQIGRAMHQLGWDYVKLSAGAWRNVRVYRAPELDSWSAGAMQERLEQELNPEPVPAY